MPAKTKRGHRRKLVEGEDTELFGINLPLQLKNKCKIAGSEKIREIIESNIKFLEKPNKVKKQKRYNKVFYGIKMPVSLKEKCMGKNEKIVLLLEQKLLKKKKLSPKKYLTYLEKQWYDLNFKMVNKKGEEDKFIDTELINFFDEFIYGDDYNALIGFITETLNNTKNEIKKKYKYLGKLLTQFNNIDFKIVENPDNPLKEKSINIIFKDSNGKIANKKYRKELMPYLNLLLNQRKDEIKFDVCYDYLQ